MSNTNRPVFWHAIECFMRPSMSGVTPPGRRSMVNERCTKRRTFGVTYNAMYGKTDPVKPDWILSPTWRIYSLSTSNCSRIPYKKIMHYRYRFYTEKIAYYRFCAKIIASAPYFLMSSKWWIPRILSLSLIFTKKIAHNASTENKSRRNRVLSLMCKNNCICAVTEPGNLGRRPLCYWLDKIVCLSRNLESSQSGQNSFADLYTRTLSRLNTFPALWIYSLCTSDFFSHTTQKKMYISE